MSGLDQVFKEFYETSKIENSIIDNHRKFDEYNIMIYCIEQNIDAIKEENRLFNLCQKHGVGYVCSDWDISFELYLLNHHIFPHIFLVLRKKG